MCQGSYRSNSIFLIFSGYVADHSSTSSPTLPGQVDIWSSTQGNEPNDNGERAYHLDAGIILPSVWSGSWLYEGRPIRPVTK